MPLHPLARRDSDKAPLYKLQEFFSIFEGILMQISGETASNLHTSGFSISLRPCQIWKHSASRNPVEVLRADGTVAQRTHYFGSSQFRLTDTIVGMFANDVWRIASPLVLQFGIRVDWDRVFHSTTFSPRISANLLPFKNNTTTLTIAWGEYLQPATCDSINQELPIEPDRRDLKLILNWTPALLS